MSLAGILSIKDGMLIAFEFLPFHQDPTESSRVEYARDLCTSIAGKVSTTRNNPITYVMLVEILGRSGHMFSEYGKASRPFTC